MTLSVHVVVFDEAGEPAVLDTPATASDLAGFESFRRTVWGSGAVRGLGAVFFPVLAHGNLTVAPDDVAAFLAECTLLREHLERIVPVPDPGHSRDDDVHVVSTRLANIEAAALRAREIGGGVLIW